MIIAMFLAHLVGDYVLQWNRLASWKAREMKGVLVHGLIVAAVTWLFSLPFDPTWWPGVAVIGLSHTAVDAFQLRVRLPLAPLLRFALDQLAHVAIIVLALAQGGFLRPASIAADMLASLHDERILAYMLGYAFVTMPAWVVVKFLVYGLVNGSAPNFAGGANKYLGIFERLLITTFVALGHFVLIPLVAAPRLVYEWPHVGEGERGSLYIAELLVSLGLSIATGLALSQL
jgi:hypothetical protein